MLPGWNIAALLHEGSQSEPEAVFDREMIGQRLSVSIGGGRWRLFHAPLCGSESAHHEQDDADAQVSERHAHPHFLGQRVHETEDARELLDRFLDHYTDPEIHERLGEIHHPLARRVDGQRRHRQIGFLEAMTLVYLTVSSQHRPI